jgi:hypothetical protein
MAVGEPTWGLGGSLTNGAVGWGEHSISQEGMLRLLMLRLKIDCSKEKQAWRGQLESS